MSYPKLNELPVSESNKSSLPGKMNNLSGTVMRVKITIDPEFTPVVPVLIPDLDSVRAFATDLHRKNQDWQGDAFGWETEYHASCQEQPQYQK